MADRSFFPGSRRADDFPPKTEDGWEDEDLEDAEGADEEEETSEPGEDEDDDDGPFGICEALDQGKTPRSSCMLAFRFRPVRPPIQKPLPKAGGLNLRRTGLLPPKSGIHPRGGKPSQTARLSFPPRRK